MLATRHSSKRSSNARGPTTKRLCAGQPAPTHSPLVLEVRRAHSVICSVRALEADRHTPACRSVPPPPPVPSALVSDSDIERDGHPCSLHTFDIILARRPKNPLCRRARTRGRAPGPQLTASPPPPGHHHALRRLQLGSHLDLGMAWTDREASLATLRPSPPFSFSPPPPPHSHPLGVDVSHAARLATSAA